jgi:catechol 2,3-dioxygenase-like lactoylglutathione lyase family enzyme
MLEDSKVVARIPVQDLRRAKSFYAEKLGLEPAEERPRGLLYRCGDGEFALFESAGAASGDHTQMTWEVEDIEATVERLRARGVVFEEYDLPGLRMVNGIAEVAGNYPEQGGRWREGRLVQGQRGQSPRNRPTDELTQTTPNCVGALGPRSVRPSGPRSRSR